MYNNHAIIIKSLFLIKKIKQQIYCVNDNSIIITGVPDHLSDLKGLDDSIFLSESKCYSTFLHPELACHPFH